MNRQDFDSLINDVIDNLDEKDYKTTVNNRKYNFKNAEKFMLEIITKKIDENVACKLYIDLI